MKQKNSMRNQSSACVPCIRIDISPLGWKEEEWYIQSFFIYIYILFYILVVSMVLFCSFYTLISFYHLILVQLNVEFILFMEAVVIIMCVMINVKWEKPRAKIIHIWVAKNKAEVVFRINLVENLWKLLY